MKSGIGSPDRYYIICDDVRHPPSKTLEDLLSLDLLESRVIKGRVDRVAGAAIIIPQVDFVSEDVGELQAVPAGAMPRTS